MNDINARPFLVELSVDAIPYHGYGWQASFVERPGESLSVGSDQSSIAHCLDSAMQDVPEHSLVEIRFNEICAGSWHATHVAQNPEKVGVEMLGRLAGLRVLD